MTEYQNFIKIKTTGGAMTLTQAAKEWQLLKAKKTKKIASKTKVKASFRFAGERYIDEEIQGPITRENLEDVLDLIAVRKGRMMGRFLAKNPSPRIRRMVDDLQGEMEDISLEIQIMIDNQLHEPGSDAVEAVAKLLNLKPRQLVQMIPEIANFDEVTLEELQLLVDLHNISRQINVMASV